MCEGNPHHKPAFVQVQHEIHGGITTIRAKSLDSYAKRGWHPLVERWDGQFAPQAEATTAESDDEPQPQAVETERMTEDG